MDGDKIQPIKPCGFVRQTIVNPTSESYGRFSTNAQRVANAISALDAAFAKDKETHEANVPALAANRDLAKRLEEQMLALGFPRSEWELNPKSRSAHTRYNTVDAGWLRSIRAHVPVDDGFSACEQAYTRLKSEFERAAKAAADADARTAREKEMAENAAKARRVADLKLLELCQRRGFDIGTNYDTALDKLRASNQRLDLAVAMMQTRDDWSEGCYRVEDALDRFKPSCPDEEAMANEASGNCAEWGEIMDGRVFRDSCWNYDRIIGTLDEQLRKDAMFLYENVPSW